MTPTWFVFGWLALHVLALASACGTRIAAGSKLESLAQLGFFLALAAVGAAAFLGQIVDAGWVWSAMTFMAMVITAVVDFRQSAEPAHAGLRG